MATRKPIAEVLERWEHIFYPLVLIVLGLVILIEGGAFGLSPSPRPAAATRSTGHPLTNYYED